MADDLPRLEPCPVCLTPEALETTVHVTCVATTPEPLSELTRHGRRQACACPPGAMLDAWHLQEQEGRRKLTPWLKPGAFRSPAALGPIVRVEATDHEAGLQRNHKLHSPIIRDHKRTLAEPAAYGTGYGSPKPYDQSSFTSQWCSLRQPAKRCQRAIAVGSQGECLCSQQLYPGETVRDQGKLEDVAVPGNLSFLPMPQGRGFQKGIMLTSSPAWKSGVPDSEDRDG